MISGLNFRIYLALRMSSRSGYVPIGVGSLSSTHSAETSCCSCNRSLPPLGRPERVQNLFCLVALLVYVTGVVSICLLFYFIPVLWEERHGPLPVLFFGLGVNLPVLIVLLVAQCYLERYKRRQTRDAPELQRLLTGQRQCDDCRRCGIGVSQ